MNAIQFIQSTLFELNRSLVVEVEPLTPEQMLYRPAPDANSISFLLWHFPRVEDNIFHRVSTVSGMPPIWESERWYERFGLKESDTGAGFTRDQVAGFKPDKKLVVPCGGRPNGSQRGPNYRGTGLHFISTCD